MLAEPSLLRFNHHQTAQWEPRTLSPVSVSLKQSRSHVTLKGGLGGLLEQREGGQGSFPVSLTRSFFSLSHMLKIMINDVIYHVALPVSLLLRKLSPYILISPPGIVEVKHVNTVFMPFLYLYSIQLNTNRPLHFIWKKSFPQSEIKFFVAWMFD